MPAATAKQVDASRLPGKGSIPRLRTARTTSFRAHHRTDGWQSSSREAFAIRYLRVKLVRDGVKRPSVVISSTIPVSAHLYSTAARFGTVGSTASRAQRMP